MIKPTEDALHSLRERVLRASLNVLAVAVPVISAFIFFVALGNGIFDHRTIGLGIYVLTFPLLRWASPRLGFRWSAFGCVALLALTAFLGELRGGLVVGPILMNALVMVLASLFFGRRGAVLSFLSVLALFTLAGFAVTHGFLAESGVMWDPMLTANWVRQGLSLAGFSAAIVVTEVYVVERLAQEAQRLSVLAELERQHRLARERAEEGHLASQKALEASRRTEALARLAGGIAHDFNNALTVIINTTDSLEACATDPAEVKACAAEILAAARSATQLTRQLLTLGRHQVSKPAPLAMEPFLERIRAAFRRLLPSNIQLLGGSPGGEPVVAQVDAAGLERAIFNLVINARDAMPGGGRLTVDCAWEPQEGGGRRVALSVTDTGEGMSPEATERIFEPFFTTKAAGVGSGLGLATVNAFVAEAGGEIQVRSTPGKGTAFTLRLPAGDGAAPQPVNEAPPPSSAFPRKPRHLGVLVVDDREDVRNSMVRTLVRGGFEATVAADGERALTLIAGGGDFGVLCIDGLMPGMPTSLVIERAQALAPTMRILLCSGHLPDDLVRGGVLAGRYAFLQKPFSSEDLLLHVRELLAPASRPS